MATRPNMTETISTVKLRWLRFATLRRKRALYQENGFPVGCGCRSVGDCPPSFWRKTNTSIHGPWGDESDKRLSIFDKKRPNATLDKWNRVRNLVKSRRTYSSLKLIGLQAMDDRAYEIVQKDEDLLSALQ